MRVLHVVYNSWPDVTGAAIRTRYLVRAQTRLGVRPIVLSAPFQPPADPAAAQGVEYADGIPHYRCYAGSDPARFMARDKTPRERAAKLAAWPGFARQVARVARRERVDLIHAHNLFFCGLAAAAAGRWLGVPVVYEVRSLVEEGMEGLSPAGQALFRRLEGIACRFADHVTVLCRGLAEELSARGVPSGKMTVAGNGVDTEAHRPAGAARRETGVVGFVGTLVWYEGLDLLLDAAAKRSGFRIRIVGDGPARADLEQQVKRLRLEGRVEFAGRIPHEEVGRYYNEMDVVALPRLATPLTDRVTPLKPLEIMARGKALAASDCGGHRELIEDGVNGVLFPAGDAAALAARIEGLLRDPAERTRLGRAGRDWVERTRTWEAQQQPVVDLYRRLAEAGRPEVLLVGPAPGPVTTGGVAKGVAMILQSELAQRYRIRLWDRSRRRLLRYTAAVAARRPRVVHVKSSSGVNFWESVFYAAIGRLAGARVLLQLHSGDFADWYGGHRALGRWAVRRGLHSGSEILVLSERWRRMAGALVGGRPIHVAPNGVEVPEAAARRANGTLRVVTLGTLGRHKGHFEILEAAALLRDHPVQFVLAGPDRASGRGEGAEVRRRAAELGLNGNVVFAGVVDPEGRRRLFEESDVLLLPSHAEAMPNAVLEAMAAGLAVVATPVGAIPEMLPEGVLVPVRDSRAVAEAIETLRLDSERRLALGRNNRERAERRYGMARVVEILDKLYR